MLVLVLGVQSFEGRLGPAQSLLHIPTNVLGTNQVLKFVSLDQLQRLFSPATISWRPLAFREDALQVESQALARLSASVF
jgi:hypothetical protein